MILLLFSKSREFANAAHQNFKDIEIPRVLSEAHQNFKDIEIPRVSSVAHQNFKDIEIPRVSSVAHQNFKDIEIPRVSSEAKKLAKVGAGAYGAHFLPTWLNGRAIDL